MVPPRLICGGSLGNNAAVNQQELEVAERVSTSAPLPGRRPRVEVSHVRASGVLGVGTYNRRTRTDSRLRSLDVTLSAPSLVRQLRLPL